MKKLRYCIVIIFLIIILSPILLITAKKLQLTKHSFGGNLSGYFDSHKKIEYSKKTFLNREYQKKFEEYINSTIPLRGYYIRLFKQLQFTFFKLSTSIIGKNTNLFEISYINVECGLDPQFDYSIPEKYSELKEYVKQLETLQKNLKKINKDFLFYITPSKANVNYDDIPDKYRNKKAIDYIPPYFYLKKLLSETDINYIDSRDYFFKEGIPAFYKTGIHWSRPVEQKVSKEIVDRLSIISNKNLPKIELKELKTSNTPIKRDADLFNLDNVIIKPHGTYYEYETNYIIDENYYKPKFLIQGGSFSDGFYKYDYADFADESYKIFYELILRDKAGNQKKITSWEDIDFTDILNQIDFVIIEVNEAAIPYYSSNFAGYLNNILDTYTPDSKK